MFSNALPIELHEPQHKKNILEEKHRNNETLFLFYAEDKNAHRAS